MRVSYSWLNELVDGLPRADQLAERLLLLGLEVASIERTGPDFTGVVVGQVLTKEKHPNADRLSLCTVSDGKASFPVVCGAPNVEAGQRVALAKVGARLPGDFKIKSSKIRGAVSEGMICSAKELGLPDPGVDGILVLGEGAALGQDFAATLGPGDALLEVEIGPNRPDCLSHVGLARELAVHLGTALRLPPEAPAPGPGPAPLPVAVADPAACPRYAGLLVSGATVGPSPEAMRRRLEACGLRPINGAVDVTNFLLLENGQPLHVFDADKLRGRRIEVRAARAGESLKALDGRTYALTPEDLVIADAEGPVAIAGVMGGEPTGVTESTKNIFIECARFHPGRIRRTAKRLGLRTDSSTRFERGVDPAALARRAARAAALVVENCGGQAGPLTDSAPSCPPPPAIKVTAARVNELLGTAHPAPAVDAVLGRLAERVDGDAVFPPSWRLDLAIPEDLAEEVGRHLGYDKIPEDAAPARLSVPVDLAVPTLTEALSDALAGLGFQEAMNYDFLSERELERVYGPAASVDMLDGAAAAGDLARLLNPLSEDWAAMRPTLLGGLLRNAALNQNRGAAGGRLFESGRVYRRLAAGVHESTRLAGVWWGGERKHWKRSAPAPDVQEAAGLIDALLRGRPLEKRPGAAGDALFHPKASLTLLAGGRVVGRLGELHPDTLRRWELGGPATAFELDLDALAAAPAPAPRYAPVSPFPAVERDLSLLVDEAAPFEDLRGPLQALKVPALVRLELIDVFAGQGLPAGKLSWTVRLTFSAPDRTLTEADIKAAMDKATGLPFVRDALRS
ncbi:MAG: phenylalanine--tRNA ligase subunit beta [Elusimicrobia bacterium]|nr:phenylalanine--tRNA ligase subunit beta [Elusimicrobiota bacterium]